MTLMTLAPLLTLSLLAADKAATKVSLAEGQRLAAKANTFVLDVRTSEEYADGHVERSKLLPIQELERRLAELPKSKSKPILVYCASGRRSAKAAALLAEKGYANVYDMTDGFVGWRQAGLPVAR